MNEHKYNSKIIILTHIFNQISSFNIGKHIAFGVSRLFYIMCVCVCIETNGWSASVGLLVFSWVVRIQVHGIFIYSLLLLMCMSKNCRSPKHCTKSITVLICFSFSSETKKMTIFFTIFVHVLRVLWRATTFGVLTCVHESSEKSRRELKIATYFNVYSIIVANMQVLQLRWPIEVKRFCRHFADILQHTLASRRDRFGCCMFDIEIMATILRANRFGEV